MMRRTRRFISLPLLVTALAGFLFAVPAAADQVVYFVNGKAITVKKVEKGDRLTILEIDGGGRIGVPTAQIDRIEELQLSPPSQGIVAPPVAAAPAQSAPGSPAAGTVQPAGAMQQATQPTGPGFGGQSVQPNAVPGGPAPLQIADSPKPETAAPRPAVSSPILGAGPRANTLQGGARQMNPRRDGAIGQPNVGLRRPGPRSGAFRGRSSMALYQPPLAPTDRRTQNRGEVGEQPSAGAPPATAPEVQPATEPAAPPEEANGDQAADTPAADDPGSAEPPAEDGGDPPEEH